jgi:cystathionine beta-lyase/cystathionine gamma-synthase
MHWLQPVWAMVRVVPRMYDRVAELCSNALSLIAALAWHTAIQELLDATELPSHNKVYYAVAVTGLAAVVASTLHEGGALLHKAEARVERLGREAPILGSLT